ncbi:hypothetical protein BaRGS_00025794, partial [Batillaria attramentaria]
MPCRAPNILSLRIPVAEKYWGILYEAPALDGSPDQLLPNLCEVIDPPAVKGDNWVFLCLSGDIGARK